MQPNNEMIETFKIHLRKLMDAEGDLKTYAMAVYEQDAIEDVLDEAGIPMNYREFWNGSIPPLFIDIAQTEEKARWGRTADEEIGN